MLHFDLKDHFQAGTVCQFLFLLLLLLLQLLLLLLLLLLLWQLQYHAADTKLTRGVFYITYGILELLEYHKKLFTLFCDIHKP
jgi:hypothetical protein